MICPCIGAATAIHARATCAVVAPEAFCDEIERAKVIVIPGATTLLHLEENIAATNLTLSDEDFRSLSNSS